MTKRTLEVLLETTEKQIEDIDVKLAELHDAAVRDGKPSLMESLLENEDLAKFLHAR